MANTQGTPTTEADFWQQIKEQMSPSRPRRRYVHHYHRSNRRRSRKNNHHSFEYNKYDDHHQLNVMDYVRWLSDTGHGLSYALSSRRKQEYALNPNSHAGSDSHDLNSVNIQVAPYYKKGTYDKSLGYGQVDKNAVVRWKSDGQLHPLYHALFKRNSNGDGTRSGKYSIRDGFDELANFMLMYHNNFSDHKLNPSLKDPKTRDWVNLHRAMFCGGYYNGKHYESQYYKRYGTFHTNFTAEGVIHGNGNHRDENVRSGMTGNSSKKSAKKKYVDNRVYFKDRHPLYRDKQGRIHSYKDSTVQLYMHGKRGLTTHLLQKMLLSDTLRSYGGSIQYKQIHLDGKDPKATVARLRQEDKQSAQMASLEAAQSDPRVADLTKRINRFKRYAHDCLTSLQQFRERNWYSMRNGKMVKNRYYGIVMPKKWPHSKVKLDKTDMKYFGKEYYEAMQRKTGANKAKLATMKKQGVGANILNGIRRTMANNHAKYQFQSLETAMQNVVNADYPQDAQRLSDAVAKKNLPKFEKKYQGVYLPKRKTYLRVTKFYSPAVEFPWKKPIFTKQYVSDSDLSKLADRVKKDPNFDVHQKPGASPISVLYAPQVEKTFKLVEDKAGSLCRNVQLTKDNISKGQLAQVKKSPNLTIDKLTGNVMRTVGADRIYLHTNGKISKPYIQHNGQATAYVGTNAVVDASHPKSSRGKQIASSSLYGYGFNFQTGTGKRRGRDQLYVFEDPIDAISYYNRHQNTLKYKNATFLSLGGVDKTYVINDFMKFVHAQPGDFRHVYLGFDNDGAGHHGTEKYLTGISDKQRFIKNQNDTFTSPVTHTKQSIDVVVPGVEENNKREYQKSLGGSMGKNHLKDFNDVVQCLRGIGVYKNMVKSHQPSDVRNLKSVQHLSNHADSKMNINTYSKMLSDNCLNSVDISQARGIQTFFNNCDYAQRLSAQRGMPINQRNPYVRQARSAYLSLDKSGHQALSNLMDTDGGEYISPGDLASYANAHHGIERTTNVGRAPGRANTQTRGYDVNRSVNNVETNLNKASNKKLYSLMTFSKQTEIMNSQAHDAVHQHRAKIGHLMYNDMVKNMQMSPDANDRKDVQLMTNSIQKAISHGSPLNNLTQTTNQAYQFSKPSIRQWASEIKTNHPNELKPLHDEQMSLLQSKKQSVAHKPQPEPAHQGKKAVNYDAKLRTANVHNQQTKKRLKRRDNRHQQKMDTLHQKQVSRNRNQSLASHKPHRNAPKSNVDWS